MKKLIILLIFPILFVACSKKVYLSSGEVEKTQIDNSIVIPQHSDISKTISPYREALEDQMNKVIGHASQTLEKNKVNGTLGLFVADAVLESVNKKYEMQADFCILNHGGLRISELYKGDITVSEIYELMPFDNTVSIMEIKGENLQLMADRIAAYGGWPISKGIEITIRGNKASSVKVHGAEIKDDATYTMITNSYIADGGDNSDFLIGTPRTNKPYMVRQAIIDYIMALSDQNIKISQKSEQRIKIEH